MFCIAGSFRIAMPKGKQIIALSAFLLTRVTCYTISLTIRGFKGLLHSAAGHTRNLIYLAEKAFCMLSFAYKIHYNQKNVKQPLSHSTASRLMLFYLQDR
ncbi:hypothetical protein O6H91_Y453800 [Diphasiastrum complanatum]|nr:hypothetical protein O6H91_Y453800 [Diphasiastrum complanatum]